MQIKCKDFIAQINYIPKTKCFYGEIMNCLDLIIFQAEHKHDLQEAFKIAVDQYSSFLQLSTHLELKLTTSIEPEIELENTANY